MGRDDHGAGAQPAQKELPKLLLPEVVGAEDVPLDDLVDVAAEPLGPGAREGAVAATEDRVVAVDDDLVVFEFRFSGGAPEEEEARLRGRSGDRRRGRKR